MSEKTVIFYFSESGNSLYVAKKIAEAVQDVTLVRIPDEDCNKKNKYEGYKRVGFIIPLYFMSMPKMVWDFIEKLELQNTEYVFSIITRAYSKGKIFKDIDSLLVKKGLRLNYGRYITYPDSYTRWYPPVKEESRQKIYIESDEEIKKLNQEILQQKQFVEKEEVSIRLFAKVFYGTWRVRLSTNYKSFKVNKNCTSCGICKKTCPARNIELKEGMPVWSNKCEDCMACVQHCPKRAIYFNRNTEKKARYMHPAIHLHELLHWNE